MRTQFVINGGVGSSDLDNYENGCAFDGSVHFTIDDQFYGDTLDELLRFVADEFRGNDLLINSCDTFGRVDLQVLQQKPDDRSDIPPDVLQAWKDGKREYLYATTYTFSVQLVQTDIDLRTYTSSYPSAD